MANPLKHPDLFNKVEQGPYREHVGVTDPSYIRIDFPTVLTNMVTCLIEDEGYHIDDKDSYSDDITHFAIQSDVNGVDLQNVLINKGIPHDFSVENHAEEHETRKYRYINGDYLVSHSNELTEYIFSGDVINMLQQQALTALMLQACRKQLLGGAWDYTPADISKAKQIALTWAVTT